ncbi:MAG: SDR family NAD(P)-dependent oxidoreductase [Methanomicrobiales archaeon]|nr:SDR family NAD(P)-dependent oxidoreductase [Methanomicrobiales archaeon]
MATPVILVTGSTDGIGKAAARALALRGATVIIHGRDEEKCRKVLRDLKESTGNTDLSFLSADFIEQQNVRRLAEEVASRYERLDVLINNAGTCETTRKLTPEGHETTFQVNYLAPFLLTRLLLPLLEKSAPSRIVNVSSIAHENLQGEKSFTLYGSYALSKVANITFTYTLAERIAGSGVTVTCVHPGVIATRLLNTLFPSIIGMPPSEGAKYLVYLALSPEVEGISGQYFNFAEKPGRSSVLTYDPVVQERLWRVAEELTGLS